MIQGVLPRRLLNITDHVSEKPTSLDSQGVLPIRIRVNYRYLRFHMNQNAKSSNQLCQEESFLSRLEQFSKEFDSRLKLAHDGHDLGGLTGLLVEMWQLWVASDRMARNQLLSFALRRRAAVGCELLISFRYQILKKIDFVMEGKILGQKSN